MAMLKLSPFILLVFYNVAGCSSVYTNTWAVKMLCYEPCVRLEGLARKHGFENLSQVSRNLLFITLVKEVVESRS